MADSIKEALQVKVYYILVAVRDYGLRLSQRIMTATPRTEPEAVPAELLNIPCQMVLPRRCLRSSIYRSALPRSSFRIPSLLHGGSHCLEAMFSAFFPAYGNFQLLSFN